MNSIDSDYLKTVKPHDLEVGKFYPCETIRKVESVKFGGSNYVLKSKEFQMFLPKRYSSLNIEEKVKGRQFAIKGFISSSKYPTKSSPSLQFIITQNVEDEGEEEEETEDEDEEESQLFISISEHGEEESKMDQAEDEKEEEEAMEEENASFGNSLPSIGFLTPKNPNEKENNLKIKNLRPSRIRPPLSTRLDFLDEEEEDDDDEKEAENKLITF